MNRRLCVMVAVLAGALVFAGVAQSQPGGGPRHLSILSDWAVDLRD